MIGKLEQIVGEALERPQRERAEFLARECAADDRLRREAESLLQAHEQAGEFLLHPTPLVPEPGTDTQPAAAAESPGSMVGPYKLLQQIGEGGFGAVFLAEQRTPVQRRVAVKVLKLGMDTRAVLARFDAERQALAMMDHPNIARVLDAGATQAGRPYFAMELVRGVPITTFCDNERLCVGDRLGLFTEVCHAVQHAHTKGIIHRDLKPSNILVSRYDDRAAVKVIDFGIAKAVAGAGRLTDRTLFTDFRLFLGTPAYMSPEQAGMSDLDVDTRGDVYSLGVLLYELLTGVTPIDNKRLLDTDYDEMRRIIREEEPPTPSTSVAATMERGRLRTGSAAQPDDDAVALKDSAEIARRRATDPRALCTELRGDLDWIVMKCLEKDRTRRYETANGLAADVQRHLAGEPVVAAPPSAAYRAMKFVKRHRAGVIAATLVLAALVLGMVGTGIGLMRARQQRELAEKRAKETQQVSEFQAAMLSSIDVEAMGRGIKDRLREQVRAALKRQYVGEFPNRHKRTPEEIAADLAAFDQRADAAQTVDVARGVIDEFVLARAADALEKQFADQPLVQAELHDAIGRTYQELGLYEAAEPHFRKALETRQGELGEHEQVADSLHNLAALLMVKGDPAAAEPLFREALAMNRKLHGDEHPAVAECLHDLARLLGDKGDHAGGERLARQALAMRRRLYGDEHPLVASSLNTLAILLKQKGDYHAAEQLYRDALAMRRKLLGYEHLDVAESLNNLAALFMQKGDDAAAEPLYGDAVEILRKRQGEEGPRFADELNMLAVLLLGKGDHAGAEPLLREGLSIACKQPGSDGARCALFLHHLARCLDEMGNHADALPLARESVALYRQRSDMSHEYAHALLVLANVLRATRDLEGAEKAARESVELYRANQWPRLADNWYPNAVSALSQTLIDAGKPDDAILVQREFVEDCRRQLPAGDLSLASPLGQFGLLLVALAKYVDAEPILQECTAIREKALAPDSPDYWYVVNARSMLGGALAGEGAALIGSDPPAAIAKLTEAEPLLVESGKWLTQNADHIPPPYRAERLHQALERIVKLYESWDTAAPGSGKAAHAAQWRAELEKLPKP